jgi:hypothetical protein
VVSTKLGYQHRQ